MCVDAAALVLPCSGILLINKKNELLVQLNMSESQNVYTK